MLGRWPPVRYFCFTLIPPPPAPFMTYSLVAAWVDDAYWPFQGFAGITSVRRHVEEGQNTP